MKKISVVMIEDNIQLCDLFAEYFGTFEEFDFIGYAHNAKDGYNLILNQQPDIAIIDIILPMDDGLSILERLQKENIKKRPINVMFTGVTSESIISKSMTLGADYVFVKPFDLTVMKKRLIQMYEYKMQYTSCVDKGSYYTINKMHADNTNFDENIKFILFNMGISSHLKGYKYIKFAVKLCIENDEFLEGITKCLYPEIARKFNTSCSSVEHAIRNSIDFAWKKSSMHNYYEILGFDIVDKSKPTNRAFISSIVQYFS